MPRCEDALFDVAIVGAGFAGLGMAHALKQEGRRRFIILERAETLGGTWRDNRYPGCACDVPAHLYSFSWAPNPNWSRHYAGQAEIQDYLNRTAREYGLYGHIRFGWSVTRLAYDDRHHEWQLQSADGRIVKARCAVLGTGPLNIPAYPDIEGLDRFQGRMFHSSDWDETYDLAGKRVAVIGTGASAIQFVPQIAPKVASLALFQRTPPWILPKPDFAIPERWRARFRQRPALRRLFRSYIYAQYESTALSFIHVPRLIRLAERRARRHLQSQIADPALRAKLTPDYRIGCKRVLISNDYYPALTRDNMELVTDPIARIDAGGVVGADGRRWDVDAILLGTGFRATDMLSQVEVQGSDGRRLAEDWADSPQAYLGITVAGYPNLFLMTGPNTGLGHNSIIYMIESQVAYILSCLRALDRSGAQALNVREAVQARFNARVQKQLTGTVWQAGGCQSWYQNAEGRNVALWPGFTFSYRRATARVRLRDYRLLT